MNNTKTKISKVTGKYRDKCGDCYYNGNCPILLKECIFKSKTSIKTK